MAESQDAAVPIDLAANWVQTVPSFPDGVPELGNAMDPVRAMLGGDDIPWTDVAVAGDGSVYLLCNVRTQPGGTLTNSVVLVKYGEDGERQWHKQIPPLEGGMIVAFGLAVDRAGNAYLTGWYQRDQGGQLRQFGYIASYAADGDGRWSYEVEHVEPDAATQFFGITVAGDRVIAAGTAYRQAVRSAGRYAGKGRSALAVCLNASNGRELWSGQYMGGDEGDGTGIDVAVTSEGRVCISGLYSPRAMRGRDQTRSQGFVLGLDRRGEQAWGVQAGLSLKPADMLIDQFNSQAYYLAAGQFGEVYLYGSASEGRPQRDARGRRESVSPRFMSRISGTGQVVWAHRLPRDLEGLSGSFRQGRHAVAPDGTLHVPGVMDGGLGRPAVIRYDADGNVLDLQILAKTRHYDELDAIAFGPRGSITVTGQHVVPQGGQGGGLFNDDGVQRPDPDRRPAQPPVFFVARIDLAVE